VRKVGLCRQPKRKGSRKTGRLLNQRGKKFGRESLFRNAARYERGQQKKKASLVGDGNVALERRESNSDGLPQRKEKIATSYPRDKGTTGYFTSPESRGGNQATPRSGIRNVDWKERTLFLRVIKSTRDQRSADTVAGGKRGGRFHRAVEKEWPLDQKTQKKRGGELRRI